MIVAFEYCAAITLGIRWTISTSGLKSKALQLRLVKEKNAPQSDMSGGQNQSTELKELRRSLAHSGQNLQLHQ